LRILNQPASKSVLVAPLLGKKVLDSLRKDETSIRFLKKASHLIMNRIDQHLERAASIAEARILSQLAIRMTLSLAPPWVRGQGVHEMVAAL